MNNSKEKGYRVLGIDPGTRITGYGIIESDGKKFNSVDYGCIRPPAAYKLSDKYLIIYNAVEELIAKYKPQAVAVETQYVYKNVQSALKLGMARGAVLIAAKKHGISVFEYAPTKLKLAVVGRGRASKFQVQAMVKALLQLMTLPEPEDAADALALAICHCQTSVHLLHKFEI